jgi:RimJ/RimL family protein N-acetyltransferase
MTMSSCTDRSDAACADIPAHAGTGAIVLETPRLRVRRLDAGDAAFIRKLVNEPSWLRFIGERNVHSLDDARAYIANGPNAMVAQHGFGLDRVELISTGEPIGICGLLKRETLEHVDIGFALLPRYWSQGYAFEAAAAVLAHGRRTFGLRRIIATTRVDNDASGRLLEKLGLRFERNVRLKEDADEVRLYGVDY